MLWLDGAYGWVPGQGLPVFRAQPEVMDADGQLLVQRIRIRVRVLRALRNAGKWVDEDAAADADGAPADDLLPGLAAAAVAGPGPVLGLPTRARSCRTSASATR